MTPMRVLISPTTMQGDIYALAHYLERRMRQGAPLEVVVALDAPRAYRKEPIHTVVPLELPLWDRSSFGFQRRVKKFAPHFWVADNHLPKTRCFDDLIYLWHGFGWKEQRAKVEFRSVHAELERLIGSVKQNNPKFIHQCYGAFEKEHRVLHTEFHPDNCLVMGNLYADLLVRPPVSRAQLAPLYPFGNNGKATVLLGFTWGFGEIFAHYGQDEGRLIERLLDFLAERDANVIFRLHDRRRYRRGYLRTLMKSAARYPNVVIKFKDVDRDNLADVLMSDVIVSNFSGIVVYAYFTGAASVHLDPFAGATGPQPLLRFSGGKAVVDSGHNYVWKMPPEENGGLLARDVESLFDMLARALDDPSCCRSRSRSFTNRYMETSDGRCCERFYQYLERWHRTGQKPRPEP